MTKYLKIKFGCFRKDCCYSLNFHHNLIFDSKIKFVFYIKNKNNNHFGYAQNFKGAIQICELLCNVKDEEWEIIKTTDNFHQIKEYVVNKGFIAEVLI